MRNLLACIIFALAAGCASWPSSGALPSQGYRYLELAVEESFETGDSWRSYDGAGVFLGARNGAFLIDIVGRQYVWTQTDNPLDNVVLEAELVQTSSDGQNAFGLACRLDPGNSGRGYFFLISGDGHASIRWSNGRSLEQVAPARPAAPPIKRDGARNRLRAVCIGDYLALWVNDHFVMEARDQRTSTGVIGMAGVMNYEGRLALKIDDLKAWRAGFDDRGP